MLCLACEGAVKPIQLKKIKCTICKNHRVTFNEKVEICVNCASKYHLCGICGENLIVEEKKE